MARTTKPSAEPSVVDPGTILTPALDALILALAATYSGSRRWTIEGWAAHIKPARHALHAINSFVKHEGEFDHATRHAVFVVTVARCADFGMASDETISEILARRAKKLAAVADESGAARAASSLGDA